MIIVVIALITMNVGDRKEIQYVITTAKNKIES